MKVGIVGCGFIGQKRAKNLCGHELVAVCDVDAGRAKPILESNPSCCFFSDWEELIKRDDIDAVIVCTTHNLLAPIGLAALKSGKHVLLEKPGALNAVEFKELVDMAEKNDKSLHVGFNHRFHPSMIDAKKIIDSPEAGPIMFMRARYGHGGRIGYDKEWRAEKAISGGGELIDQGMHLIDLAHMFMGEFEDASGITPTYFWDMKVEDNAFMQLKTSSKQVAWLHASWTEWKNIFSLELYSKYIKIQIDGLGGSYGTEKLTVYRMLPEMGPPPTTVTEYPGADNSWLLEFEFFSNAIKNNQRLTGMNCLSALKIADKIYGDNNDNN